MGVGSNWNWRSAFRQRRFPGNLKQKSQNDPAFGTRPLRGAEKPDGPKERRSPCARTPPPARVRAAPAPSSPQASRLSSGVPPVPPAVPQAAARRRTGDTGSREAGKALQRYGERRKATPCLSGAPEPVLGPGSPQEGGRRAPRCHPAGSPSRPAQRRGPERGRAGSTGRTRPEGGRPTSLPLRRGTPRERVPMPAGTDLHLVFLCFIFPLALLRALYRRHVTSEGPTSPLPPRPSPQRAPRGPGAAILEDDRPLPAAAAGNGANGGPAQAPASCCSRPAAPSRRRAWGARAQRPLSGGTWGAGGGEGAVWRCRGARRRAGPWGRRWSSAREEPEVGGKMRGCGSGRKDGRCQGRERRSGSPGGAPRGLGWGGAAASGSGFVFLPLPARCEPYLAAFLPAPRRLDPSFLPTMRFSTDPALCQSGVTAPLLKAHHPS